MKVAYINPFITGTREVFDAMVKMPFQVGKPRLREPDERLHKLYSVSVVIGLSGAVSGVLVMSLAEPVALALATSLTDAPATGLDQDCFDALAEIANMIAGSAKKRLPQGQISITVPTLLRTEDVFYPSGQPILILPFDCPSGRFILEIAMADVPQRAAA